MYVVSWLQAVPDAVWKGHCNPLAGALWCDTGELRLHRGEVLTVLSPSMTYFPFFAILRCVDSVQRGREEPASRPDPAVCSPCCLHWCRCFQEAPGNRESPVDAALALQCAIWPRSSFLGKKEKGRGRWVRFFFPLTDIREDSTLVVKTARVKSKLLHVCVEVWEHQ